MAGENEVCGRGQHLETESPQFADQLFAGSDDGLAGLLEILAILEGGDRTGDRQPVQRVGIETVLDPLQRFDQVCLLYTSRCV